MTIKYAYTVVFVNVYLHCNLTELKTNSIFLLLNDWRFLWVSFLATSLTHVRQGTRYVPRLETASLAGKESVLESERFHAKDTL